MSEAFFFSLALLGGIVLGTIFFGGLWWTVKRGVVSPHPALWFLSSLLLRSVIALGGFYYVARGDWRRMVVGMAGFLVARVVVTRLTRETIEAKNRLGEGGSP